MKTIRPGRIGALIGALVLCITTALIVPWRVVAQKAPEAAVQASTEEATPAELELLRKEIDLARRHVQSERQRLNSGRSTPQSLLERQRELVLLEQDLARNEGDLAGQRQVVNSALSQMKDLWREQKRRVDLGTLPPGDDLGFEREVVRLERELQALNRSLAGPTNTVLSAKATDPSRLVPISSPVSGIVTKVSVQPGAKVKKGAVLLELDNREARVKVDAAMSQVAAAEAALRLEEIEVEDAQAEYGRLKELAKQRLTSEQPSETRGPKAAEARLNKRKADVKFARAQLDLAQLALESLAVRAPRDGTVTTIRVIEGEYVTPGAKWLIVIEQ